MLPFSLPAHVINLRVAGQIRQVFLLHSIDLNSSSAAPIRAGSQVGREETCCFLGGRGGRGLGSEFLWVWRCGQSGGVSQNLLLRHLFPLHLEGRTRLQLAGLRKNELEISNEIISDVLWWM